MKVECMHNLDKSRMPSEMLNDRPTEEMLGLAIRKYMREPEGNEVDSEFLDQNGKW